MPRRGTIFIEKAKSQTEAPEERNIKNPKLKTINKILHLRYDDVELLKS